MAEEQALDRVHRLGQRRQVHAVRYIVKKSIEEVRLFYSSTPTLPTFSNCSRKLNELRGQYVVRLQRSKIQLFRGSFGANDGKRDEERRLEQLREYLDAPIGESRTSLDGETCDTRGVL